MVLRAYCRLCGGITAGGQYWRGPCVVLGMELRLANARRTPYSLCYLYNTTAVCLLILVSCPWTQVIRYCVTWEKTLGKRGGRGGKGGYTPEIISGVYPEAIKCSWEMRTPIL